MKKPPEKTSVQPFGDADAALWRAAQRARDIARQTGTLLVIYRNGRVERVNPDDVPLPKFCPVKPTKAGKG